MNDDKETLKDYYYILGVRPGVSQLELQIAYQELYDKFGPHITVKQQDPESMIKAYKDISEAWEVLGDPERRAEYDASHLPLLEKTNLRSLWGKVAGFKTDTKEVQKHKDAPADTRVVIELALRESIKGARKQVKLEDVLACQDCAGKKPVDRTKCIKCRGSATIRNDRIENIDLQPGMFDRQEIRIPGRGKLDMRSRLYADLVIEVQLLPHPYFMVAGKDVSCTVPITIYEAILGGEIETATPTGKVAIKIQPLTQPKKVYRLKGLGLGIGVERGDLLLNIEVLIPQQLHADEVELFRKLYVASSQPNPRMDIFNKLQAYNAQSQAAPAGPAGPASRQD